MMMEQQGQLQHRRLVLPVVLLAALFLTVLPRYPPSAPPIQTIQKDQLVVVADAEDTTLRATEQDIQILLTTTTMTTNDTTSNTNSTTAHENDSGVNDTGAFVVTKRRSYAAIPLIRPPLSAANSSSAHYCSHYGNSNNNSNTTAGQPLLQDKDVNKNCLIPDAIDGQWEYQANHTPLVPVCCATDREPFANPPETCGPEPVRNMPYYAGRPDGYYRGSEGHSCRCRTMNFRDSHVWTSNLLDDFDAHETCRRLGNRTVLVIGDSTMGIAASTMMNALIPGHCQAQIQRQLCDTLVHRDFGVMNRGNYWLDYVTLYQPDIVILSAGAHINNESDFVDMFQQVLGTILELRKATSQSRRRHFVWATQQPGGCTREILPLPPDEAARTHPVHRQSPFQHDRFYSRDLYALSELRQHDVPVLDLRMLYSRTDAKVGSLQEDEGGDCLHLCSPGPLEVILTLFQNLLQHELKE